MVFPEYWWFSGVALVVAMYLFGCYLCRPEEVSRVGLYEIDRMSKKEFRHFCRRLLSKVGYRVCRPQKAREWVSFVLEKEGQQIAVTVRKYAVPVGVRPVEKAAQGAVRNQCHRALVMTNREFTREAKRRAGELGVELWDRDKLVALLVAARSREK